MNRYNYYNDYDRESAREQRRKREEQRRAEITAHLLRSRLGDSLNTELQRLRNEGSLTSLDARMKAPEKGSRVNVTPLDVKENTERDIPRMPKSLQHVHRSKVEREKLDDTLCLYERDGITTQDPFAEEDEMADRLDTKRYGSATEECDAQTASYILGDTTNERIRLEPSVNVSNESDDLHDYDSYLKMVEVQYVRRKIDTLKEKQGRASNRGKQPNKRAERILTKQMKASRKYNMMEKAA